MVVLPIIGMTWGKKGSQKRKGNRTYNAAHLRAQLTPYIAYE